MHSLQKRFHDFINTNNLLEKNDNILLAVSGGLDSMVLSHLFFQSDYDFSIAHCNFKLRGDESDEDEAFVLRWADENGINCYVKSFDVEGGSIQLEARNARYLWFNQLLLEYGLDKIVTAHHLNDSLETSLINLVRGTGIKGVKGIATKSDKVVRPLLFATRKEIYTYAMDKGLDWREDSSNKKTDYYRNMIRLEVVPVLEKLNPSLIRTYFQTIERLNYTSNLIENQVKLIKAKYFSVYGEGKRLDLSWVVNDFDVILLAELLSEYGVNYITCKEIFGARDKSGKSFPTNEWLITVDREAIFIDPIVKKNFEEVEITGLGLAESDQFTLKLEEVLNEEVEFGNNYIAYFDRGSLEFPLRLRPWREGDKFQPLGMSGQKKVSDLLIDEKVPISLKQSILVLESSNEIIWVIGYRISDRVKITKGTKTVVKAAFNLK